jgi:hypothetical protein
MIFVGGKVLYLALGHICPLLLYLELALYV